MKWDDDVKDLVQSQLFNAIRLFRHEKNEPSTWHRLYEFANAILGPIRDNGLVADFKVVCDERVNDQEAIDAPELHMQIGLKAESGARYSPYHFSVILDDIGTTVMIPPDLIDKDCDFVNGRETSNEGT